MKRKGRVEQETSASFELWLKRKLHDMFDSALNEDIPPSLVDLVRQLDRKADPREDKEQT